MHSSLSIAILLYLLPISAPLATDSAVARAHLSNGDYAAAYREYRGLAEVGYPMYQNQVAKMHAEGVGVAVDRVQAYAWYSLSAAQGDSEAILAKARLGRQLTPRQLDRSRALAARYAMDYLAPYRPPGWSLD